MVATGCQQVRQAVVRSRLAKDVIGKEKNEHTYDTPWRLLLLCSYNARIDTDLCALPEAADQIKLPVITLKS
uniref:LysM domain-containing protein n=1 Tax=Angiostrongylus cantonensis TaxID=6313 RepID=A0A0K0D0Y5_ANGCA